MFWHYCFAYHVGVERVCVSVSVCVCMYNTTQTIDNGNVILSFSMYVYFLSFSNSNDLFLCCIHKLFKTVPICMRACAYVVVGLFVVACDRGCVYVCVRILWQIHRSTSNVAGGDNVIVSALFYMDLHFVGYSQQSKLCVAFKTATNGNKTTTTTSVSAAAIGDNNNGNNNRTV